MAHESRIVLRNSTSMPPPPPQAYSGRERRPPVQRVPSNAVDDDDLITLASMERERKPYVAREGSGKIYEGDVTGSYDSNRGDEMPRPTRQSSSSTIVPPSRSRQPTGPGTQPPVSFNNFARNGGRRSPPLASSWGDSSMPSEVPWSSSRSDFEPSTDGRRSSRRRAQSGSTPNLDFDTRSKPIPVRNQDTKYESGMPPPLPPMANSLPRGSSQALYDEHRRRSAYTPAPPAPEGWSTGGYPDAGR